VVANYGWRLYNFFKTYNEKVWGVSITRCGRLGAQRIKGM
jgi:hypothetical protein